MSRRASPCTQTDITRLIKGALAAGVRLEQIAGVKLTRDGATLFLGEQANQTETLGNEWDEVLKG